MAQVTPLRDPVAFEQLEELGLRDARDTRLDQVRVFVEYLFEEDAKYCHVPPHSAFDTQLKMQHEMMKVFTSK
jgi:hypothetical protein